MKYPSFPTKVVSSAGRKNRIIPKDRLAFDIDGVVADIMTTFLDLARTRYDCGQHLRYEDLTAFRLEDCGAFRPISSRASSGNLSTGPMN